MAEWWARERDRQLRDRIAGDHLRRQQADDARRNPAKTSGRSSAKNPARPSRRGGNTKDSDRR
jgi:hypothetical protein